MLNPATKSSVRKDDEPVGVHQPLSSAPSVPQSLLSSVPTNVPSSVSLSVPSAESDVTTLQKQYEAEMEQQLKHQVLEL